MPGPVVTETQVERRMEMYKQGLTDREIADQVGMAQESVSYWRRRNGLPRNAARWDSQRMSLYNQGMTDREIGRQTGQRATTICNWRAARKLPANRGTHTNLTISVPMTEALTPSQCRVMTRFLSDLLRIADMRPGAKINVGAFIREWKKGGGM